MGAYALARRAALPGAPAAGEETEESYDGASPRPAPAAGQGEQGGDGSRSVSGALETIADYLPTEGLAMYVTAFAVIAPASGRGGERDRWLIFMFAFVLNAFFTVLAMRVTGATPSTGKPGLARPTVRMALAVVLTSAGLCIYVAALPDNPFLGTHTVPALGWSWTGMTLPWAGVVAVAASMVLPILAAWVGLARRPDS